jgi:hypothetical protein
LDLDNLDEADIELLEKFAIQESQFNERKLQ